MCECITTMNHEKGWDELTTPTFELYNKEDHNDKI
jgi:hypothetical protein